MKIVYWFIFTPKKAHRFPGNGRVAGGEGVKARTHWSFGVQVRYRIVGTIQNMLYF